MPIRKIAFSLILCVILISCKKENRLDCFKSNGAEKTETREPGSFSVIEVANKMDLYIRQGAEYKVEVSAGKNLMKNILTSVTDGTLRVDNNNTCNFVRGYKKNITVNITLPYLRFVKNNGVGTVNILGFDQDTLVVRTESSGDIHITGNFNEVRTSSHGNGDMYVQGNTNSFYVYTYGTNFVYAGDLVVKNFAFVQTLSLGDCFINGSQLLDLSYNIGSSGNVYYTGTPPTITDVSELKTKGRLIKEE